MNLDVVLRNNGQASVKLALVSNWFDFESRVRRADGAAVPLTPDASQQRLALQAGGGGTLLELPGGKQAAFSIPLAEIFDFTEGGEIDIQVARNVLDSAGAPFQVVSNPIKIVVAR